jgi:DNA-binding MarR family transcriptional regulator
MSTSLEALGLFIKRMQDRHHRALDTRLTAALGVTLVQWNALREIHRNPGSSLHHLAELTFNSDQAFGMLATRLLKLGLIERRNGKGRALVHSLTAKGDALRKRGKGILLDVLERSFASLDESERATLLRLLTKLLDG